MRRDATQPARQEFLSHVSDPFELFLEWMQEAEAAEPNDPNAVALATATSDGTPSVRMVLMKKVEGQGFCFYTNSESQKGQELAENPQASMCFHWKSLRRQVRISGVVSELPPEDADAYFHSRSRGSQRAALASRQSRPLKSRGLLEVMVHEYELAYPDQIPRPPHWKGYSLKAQRIEFWQDRRDRMHDRVVFQHTAEGWSKTLLYP
ncbi:MAG: pyridoxamine 5'-phosphate oxidase [Acidobacteriota bacterium]|nr:pyridoxamine 5'-phosphate oxidase [Acidobacteriota bacterium]